MSSTFPWTEDPEFVAIYDLENSGLDDCDFYLQLVAERDAQHVADIGCGTGVFTLELARRGVEVTSVDPAGAMIEAARARITAAGLAGEQLAPITLIHGEADQLQEGSTDAVVMMGHVAQYFLHRADWDAVLRQAWNTLRPGGWLAFESRNPNTLELDLWDPENTRDSLPHPDGGELTSWLEVTGTQHDPADGDLISCRQYALLPSGKKLTADETLRYRPLTVLRESLTQAGFNILKVWGDWDRSRLDEDSPELILLAQRPA